ncbi:MAG: transporter [Bacteroidales bacterium]|jgi:putative transport protein|nr:transporter [Bacteroidales bacterium]MCK9499908.1 transporter [Bacteroidales bacterium]MDY0313605.1 aspartate:alanine exchanger family transporter [Bacteroidales bacterium]NLB87157.1 transporter [Bacteroidales bacterium]
MDILFTPYFALFLIIILGLLIGGIKIKGIGLDVSAVLFVAMAFGYFGLKIPSDLKNIGLILFIFTIGFQSGPSFFETFRKEGKNLVILTIIIVVSSAAVALACGLALGYSPALTGGLFAGGITSTPGLAAITEISSSDQATIGYGVAYPFGVIGVVLFIKLLPKLFKMDIKKAEEKFDAENLEKYPKVFNRNYIVENPEIIGKSISELNIRENTGANISRVFQNGTAFTPNPQTILYSGSIIKAVGTEPDLLKVQNLIGKPTEVGIALNENYDVKFVLVTNKKVLGKTVSELHLQSKYNIIITRIRRSGVDFSVSSNLKLQFGDKIKIAGTKEDINKVIPFLGNEANKIHEANYLPVALGIVLGVLLGQINIKLGKFDFSLGLTGGVITVAIILSRIRKIGPVVFSLTTAATQILRQIGLLLFLIGVGTEAGSSIIQILKTNGIGLFLSGVLITLIPMILAVILAKYVLKIQILQLLGGITGGMTSTPGLAAASSMTKTNAPGIAYATIYPIGMIMVIVCVQIIFWIMA